MNTKEIDVWLDTDYLEKGQTPKLELCITESDLIKLANIWKKNLKDTSVIKAKLIIEIPEEKKVFTRSDISNALCKLGWNDISALSVNKELFGEEV